MKNVYYLLAGFVLATVLCQWTLIALLVKLTWFAFVWVAVAFCAVAVLGLPIWTLIWVLRKVCEKS